MACDMRIALGQTPPQRKKQIDEAVERLNKALAIGEVKLKVGSNGAVTFIDGKVRGAVAGILGSNKISDTCAYRKLLATSSPALRNAVIQAETLAGRKINAQAVASGTHSHDGGKTWHPGH
jgi:hypothetical protein